jgi:hypothetical protein
MGWACSPHGINTYKILVREPKETRPLGRLKCRFKDSIKMDIRGIGMEGVDWINMAQDRDCGGLL